MKMNDKGFTVIELAVALFFCFAFVGECLTLYRFCKCDFEPSYKAEIIYAASLFSGLGAVTGYIDFGK
jgi:hypothetical protein